MGQLQLKKEGFTFLGYGLLVVTQPRRNKYGKNADFRLKQRLPFTNSNLMPYYAENHV